MQVVISTCAVSVLPNVSGDKAYFAVSHHAIVWPKTGARCHGSKITAPGLFLHYLLPAPEGSAWALDCRCISLASLKQLCPSSYRTVGKVLLLQSGVCCWETRQSGDDNVALFTAVSCLYDLVLELKD